MKKIFAAIAALLVSWALGSGLATATPMTITPVSSLFDVAMSGPSDVSFNANTGDFNLGGLYDSSTRTFWGANQEIGARKLQFSFLEDVEVSFEFTFSTADSTPWDTGGIVFIGDNSFDEKFSGTSWSNMQVAHFDFSRSFTASAGDTLVFSMDTWRDTNFLTWENGNIAITVVDPGANAPVPEPATMLLFGTGLLGLVGMKRRSSKKNVKA